MRSSSSPLLADLVRLQAIGTVMALSAVVALLDRDDVLDAIAAGNEKLGLHTDEGVRFTLDALGKEWTAEHDVVRGMSGRLDPPRGRAGPGGAFVVVTRHRAYRLEHLSRAKHHAARMHSELERWVTPVICLTMRDDTPHRRDGVWIMGAEHLVGWLCSRPNGAVRPSV